MAATALATEVRRWLSAGNALYEPKEKVTSSMRLR